MLLWLCVQIAFFMRKGADCLSKFVGEAERELRLLFEQVRGHPEMPSRDAKGFPAC